MVSGLYLAYDYLDVWKELVIKDTALVGGTYGWITGSLALITQWGSIFGFLAKVFANRGR